MKKTKNKVLTPINTLVAVLAFAAGWVNIMGYNLFMRTRPSSMTGRAAEIAESLGRGELNVFGYLILVVILFVIGITTSTLITRRYGFTMGLIFVVSILIADMVLVINKHHLKFFPVLLSMGMGAQNGATSMTEIGRTTHMSGATTEFGMNIAFKNWNKAIFWGIRWIFFPMGGYFSYKFIDLLKSNNLQEHIIIIVPIFIILLTAILQKKFIDVQVLDVYKVTENEDSIESIY